MWTRAVIGLALLLGSASAGAGGGDAAPATRPAGATGDETEWSDSLNGLRVRLSAPGGTTCRRGEVLPLRVEVRNVSDHLIPYRDLWPTVRVLATDEGGRWLGIPSLGPHSGDWANRPGSLAPGQSGELKFPLQSLRFNRPLKAGEVVQLRVSAPTQLQQPGKLPLEVNSPALAIRFEAPYPPALAGEEVAAPWKMDLACRLDEGLTGSRTLHVDAKGNATVVLNNQRGGERVNKRLSATLPADRLGRLAETLHKIEVWKLGGIDAGIPNPDEGAVRLALVCGSGGSVAGEFPSHLESREAAVRDLRQTVEGLMAEVETLAAKQPADH